MPFSLSGSVLRTFTIRATTLSLGLLLTGLASAGSFAIIPQAGLAGFGAVGEWAIDNTWSISAGYTALNYKTTTKTDGSKYDIDVQVRNPQLFVNWSPFAGYFRISAGLLPQDSQIKVNALKNSAGLIVVDGTPYPGIDTLGGKADFANSVSPALTIGWQTPQDKLGLGFSASLGAVYTGTPDVSIKATGSTANNSVAQQAIERERKKLENDLSKYQVLPIAQLGLLYRF
jgi:hypothetical protein